MDNYGLTHARRLRTLCQKPETLKAPGIYDGLSARLVEAAGFEAAFVSGACIAFTRFGRPDMGLVTATEVVNTISVIRERTAMPLIVDMDTGFGNALNVQRTVRTFELAGASALQMEDQVMPKRCGHMAGKQVIAKEEMVGKIKAALDARYDDSTMIIARTDALGVNGFEDALDRAEAYLQAGADALFVEAPQSLEQMQIIGDHFGERTPLVHNLVEGGNSPVDGSYPLQALGYKIALYPAALLHLFVPQAQQLLQHIEHTGSTNDWQGSPLVNLNYLNELLEAPAMLADSERYKH